jgi:hypothetical protein
VSVAHSHYARGASHWLTWDIPTTIIVTELMDSASWDKFDDYLSGRYKSGPFGILGRNKCHSQLLPYGITRLTMMLMNMGWDIQRLRQNIH